MERVSVRLACTMLDRIVGLLDSKVCSHGELLMIAPCKSIHSFGMKQNIDIAFIDKDGQVLKALRSLRPGKIVSCKNAVCVLERRSSHDADEVNKKWFKAGDKLILKKG